VSRRELPAVNAGGCMGGMLRPIKQIGMSQWRGSSPLAVSREGETKANAPRHEEADPPLR